MKKICGGNCMCQSNDDGTFECRRLDTDEYFERYPGFNCRNGCNWISCVPACEAEYGIWVAA